MVEALVTKSPWMLETTLEAIVLLFQENTKVTVEVVEWVEADIEVIEDQSEGTGEDTDLQAEDEVEDMDYIDVVIGIVK